MFTQKNHLEEAMKVYMLYNILTVFCFMRLLSKYIHYKPQRFESIYLLCLMVFETVKVLLQIIIILVSSRLICFLNDATYLNMSVLELWNRFCRNESESVVIWNDQQKTIILTFSNKTSDFEVMLLYMDHLE